MEDDYPPCEEEDEGQTYNSDELHRETQVVTSCNLLEDLLESAERRYHKTIAGLQLAHHKAVQKLMDTILQQTREYVRQHKKCNKDTVVESANQYLKKQRGEMERARDTAIEKEQERLQQQVTRIRQWVEQKNEGYTLMETGK